MVQYHVVLIPAEEGGYTVRGKKPGFSEKTRFLICQTPTSCPYPGTTKI